MKKFAPQVEDLECRVVPAARLLAGQLVVTGNNQSERIAITQTATDIKVKTVIGSRVVVKQFPKAQVARIVVQAKGGDDVVTVAQGIKKPTIMDGGAGNDTIAGGGGRDTITGGDDNDYLLGRNGNDRLSGGAGIDFLFGGAGNDLLDGSDSANVLVGGPGNDGFVNGIDLDLFVDAPIIVNSLLGPVQIGTLSVNFDDPLAVTFSVALAGNPIIAGSTAEVILGGTSLGSATADAQGNATFDFSVDFDTDNDNRPDVLDGVPLPIPDITTDTVLTVQGNSPVLGAFNESATIGELLGVVI